MKVFALVLLLASAQAFDELPEELKNPAPLRAREGGLLRDDLRVALEEGVLPGDFYADFVARHQALKGKALRSRAETEAALCALFGVSWLR